MPPALAPTWAITSAAGQPPSLIRLRNLQATARIGLDAWSRPCRPQPILISACVSLARASASSSSADRVAADTVHYGLLSKAILSTLDEVDHRVANGGDGEALSLRGLLNEIWVNLAGQHIDGSDGPAMAHTPFLDLKATRCLSISIRLPKASLAGGCVGLTGMSLFEGGEAQMYGVALDIAHMQVPTLIGVNENERKAKQVVIADVTLDCFEDGDIYPHLESAVYDVCSALFPLPLPLSLYPHSHLFGAVI